MSMAASMLNASLRRKRFSVKCTFVYVRSVLDAISLETSRVARRSVGSRLSATISKVSGGNWVSGMLGWSLAVDGRDVERLYAEIL